MITIKWIGIFHNHFYKRGLYYSVDQMNEIVHGVSHLILLPYL